VSGIFVPKRSFYYFLSYLANTQTDRQTNKLWQKHNLLGEGNNYRPNRLIVVLIVEVTMQNRRTVVLLFRFTLAAVEVYWTCTVVSGIVF